MMGRLIKLIGNVRGATAIEYGLIIALIVIAIVISIQTVAEAAPTSGQTLPPKSPMHCHRPKTQSRASIKYS